MIIVRSLFSALSYCKPKNVGSCPTRSSSVTWRTIFWIIVFSPALFQSTVLAMLHPDQLIILANENDPESMEVARYYARQRRIPFSHIVRLDLPFQETISRTDYKERLAEPVKIFLQNKGFALTTRVIVTTFGVPLRIKALPQSDQEKDWQTDAAKWRTASLDFLDTIRTELDQLLKAIKNESGSPSPGPLNSSSLNHSHSRAILGHIDTIIQNITAKIQKSPSLNIPREQTTTFFKYLLQLDGLSAYTKYSAMKLPFSENAKLPSKQWQSHVRLAKHMLPLLLQTPSTKNRNLAYQLAQRYFGVRGVFHLAISEQEQYSHKDSEASVDSELSLLWLNRHEYDLKGRTPNPLYAWGPSKTDPANDTRGMRSPLLMVSRIDAPTSKLARQMVDKALMAEQMGLSGTVYLDARGLTPKEPLGYGDYDQSLRDMAHLIKAKTSYPVILENTKKRFKRFGEASQVALYAGWYRLRHYEDAFSFNPGAIGYHIASGEAISIHNPKEKGWCKNALERGITVTIGPTSEPYVDAFPKPTEFFGLLLTGRYTLVEAYYLSTRHVGWRMVLFGDPLYNPWKGMSLAKLEDLQQAIPRFQQLNTLPPPPSIQSFPDPVQTAQARKHQRDMLLRQIPSLLNMFP